MFKLIIVCDKCYKETMDSNIVDEDWLLTLAKIHGWKTKQALVKELGLTKRVTKHICKECSGAT